MGKVYNLLLFDLDGTIINSKVAVTKSVQYALAKIGIHETNLNDLVKFIGPPLTESFKKYYRLNEDKLKLAVEYYRERYKTIGIQKETTLFSGIKTFLKKLKQKSKELFVVTSKPAVFSKQILDKFNITKYFAEIIGPDLSMKGADKTTLIKKAFNIADINKSEVVMIGDREHDIIGAKNNGIDSIGVLFGNGSIGEMKKVKPTYMVKSVKDLQHLLAND